MISVAGPFLLICLFLCWRFSVWRYFLRSSSEPSHTVFLKCHLILSGKVLGMWSEDFLDPLIYQWLFAFFLKISSVWPQTCLPELIVAAVEGAAWSPEWWIPMASEYPDAWETPVWRLHHPPVVGSDSSTLLPKNPVSVWGITLLYTESGTCAVWDGHLVHWYMKLLKAHILLPVALDWSLSLFSHLSWFSQLYPK